MSVPKDKKCLTVNLNPKTVEQISKLKDDAGFRTRSMFVEEAVKFYCGYLSAEDKSEYLPEVVDDLFNVYMEGLDDKLSNMVFKSAVELTMFLHVFCALNDVTTEDLDAVRDAAVKEVKSTYGIVPFKSFRD